MAINNNISHEPFECGTWRKATMDELKKFSKEFASLYSKLDGWYFGKSIEYIEINNSEGKSRLLLVSKDEFGNYGVNVGMDIKL